MNNQELIKKYEEILINGKSDFKSAHIYQTFLKELRQLDEPQKPVVPQFVADWIEKTKNELSLREAMSQGYAPHEVDSWLREMDQDGACLNQEPFCRAWLDGYTVEKEKRYRVKVKGMNRINGYLAYNKINGAWYFGISGNSKNHSTNHTRKELEETGFGWVFDCPGMEVEGVE